MSLTRNAFFGLAASAAGALALGGSLKAFGASEDLLRPPIVPSEEELLQRCIRCYRCISVCPEGILAPATINDGLVEFKTPKVDFHKGACTFCDECVEVCPTGVIHRCNPLSPQEGRIGYAQVFPERCLAYYEGCLVCDEACPYNAITPDESGHPVVNTELCNGCGVCEYVCPALVYRSFIGGTLRGIAVVKSEEMAERLQEQAG